MSAPGDSSASAELTWRARRLLIARTACVVLIVGGVLYEWIRITRAPHNDFDLHYFFAQHFIAGDFLYTLGFHWPYPPFWAMAHTPFTLLPLDTVQIVYYPIGLLTALGLFVLLGRLILRDRPVEPGLWFWIVMLAVLMSLRYLLRDAHELYINTTLVLLAWLGVFGWTRGRDWLGGMSLGFAIALKMTAGLFIPYFLLKRQWRFAGAAILFAGLFTVAPMLRTGPASYVEHMTQWSGRIVEGLSQENPSVGVLGEEQFENMSLRSTLVRYLMDLPIGHAGRPPVFLADGSRAKDQGQPELDRSHPGYITVLSLSPATTTWIIRLASLGLVVLVAVPMWRAPAGRDAPHIIWECAAVSILLLVLSPITWGQHCVGIVPACLLVADRILRSERQAVWMWLLLGWFAVFSVILNRAIVGRSIDALLRSYHVETFALLGLLAVVMGWRARVDGSWSPGPVTRSALGSQRADARTSGAARA